jgi:ABC-2 type transport system ATP-binding protein
VKSSAFSDGTAPARRLSSTLQSVCCIHRPAKISTLSKGQARQLALLCAVCHRPELLLLDEPAGGLDPAARREFLETSIRLLNDEGTTILFSSHHMTDVERIGGRIVLLDQGRVRLDRELDRVRDKMCVAIVPRSSAADAGAIERLPECLRLRQESDEWRAVMEGTPEDVRPFLAAALGGRAFHCTRVPLEEFFVEMAGHQR